MAQALGVHKNTVLRWEKDQLEPKASDLVGISHFTGASPNLLLLTPEEHRGIGAAENVIPYRADFLDAEILAQALGLVLQELQNRKATLPPSKIAAAVVEIYELVTSQGKKEVAVDNVTPFVRLLLAR